MSPILAAIYERLQASYGPQQRSSARMPLEALVASALGPGASEKKIERALVSLREADVLEVERLHALSEAELAELLAAAGYARPKALRLHRLLAYLVEQHGGSLAAMFAADLAELRVALLGINGIGPEAADAILLEAGGRPSFVVDLAAHRVLARHGWIDFEADYHAIQAYFHESLEPDAGLFQEFRRLLDRVGQEHCRKRPLCENCPLADLLPEGSPLEPPDWNAS